MNCLNRLLLVFTLAIFLLQVNAQQSQMFQYQNELGERYKEFVVDNDSLITAIGYETYIDSLGELDAGIKISKFSLNGDMLSSKIIYGDLPLLGTDFVKDDDAHLYIIGKESVRVDLEGYSKEGVVCKLTSENEIEWSYKYGNVKTGFNEWTIFTDIIRLSDTTILISGTTMTSTQNNGVLICIDLDGKELWSRSYYGQDSYLASLLLLPDGDIIALGDINNEGAYLVMKIDPVKKGSIKWQRKVANEFSVISDAILDNNNDIVITGEKSGLFANSYQDGAALCKLDTAGNFKWGTAFASDEDCFGYDVETDAEGNYFIAAHQGEANVAESGNMIIKTDSEGNHIWTRKYINYARALDTETMPFEIIGGKFVFFSYDRMYSHDLSLDTGEVRLFIGDTVYFDSQKCFEKLTMYTSRVNEEPSYNFVTTLTLRVGLFVDPLDDLVVSDKYVVIKDTLCDQCLLPIAEADINIDQTSGELLVENNSKHVDSLQWIYNDTIISDEFEPVYYFKTEGNNLIGFNAYNSCGVDTKYKYVYLANVPVGIDNEGLDVLSLFPNPTVDIITLSKESEWILYSLEGQVRNRGAGTKISLLDQAQGMYWVGVGNKKYKVVKQ